MFPEISGAFAAPEPCAKGFHPLDSCLRSYNALFNRLFRMKLEETSTSAGKMKTENGAGENIFSPPPFFVFPDALHPVGGL